MWLLSAYIKTVFIFFVEKITNPRSECWFSIPLYFVSVVVFVCVCVCLFVFILIQSYLISIRHTLGGGKVG